MKTKKIFLLFLVSISFNSFSFQLPEENLRSMATFQEACFPASNIMIGDSITAFGSWQALLANPNIANCGIPGDTSAGILMRLKNIILLKPKRAFLMFGINDLGKGQGIDLIINYVRIIELLQSESIDVVISSTLKCWARDCLEINSQVNELNSFLKNLASSVGAKFINIDEKLSDAAGLLDQYTMDGVHLNEMGYKVWAQELRPFVL